MRLVEINLGVSIDGSEKRPEAMGVCLEKGTEKESSYWTNLYLTGMPWSESGSSLIKLLVLPRP